MVISMKDLAAKIMALARWKGELKEFPAPIGSAKARCPDTSFLNNVLGLTPKVSLEDGLKRVLNESLAKKEG